MSMSTDTRQKYQMMDAEQKNRLKNTDYSSSF